MIIKNYLKEIEKNNVKIFSVIDPEILLKEFEKKSSKFRDLLPEFSLLTDNRWNKPKVEYFEWIEWIKSMYDDTLLIEGTVLKAFMWTQNMDLDLVEYFYSTYVPKRVKRNIKAFVILPSSDLTQKYVSSSDKELLKETITISHETFFIADEINLYGWDKVSFAMYSPDEMFWILVKSKKLHDTLVWIFDHLRWIYTDGWMSK